MTNLLTITVDLNGQDVTREIRVENLEDIDEEHMGHVVVDMIGTLSDLEFEV
jgi:hypothetical protein